MSNIAILTDEKGNFIGQKDRYSLASGDMVAIALLWVENSSGEILLAQRSLRKENDPGLWGPAVGGTLEPGETFESNVIKESEEEIGLSRVKPVEIIRKAYWREDDDVGRYAVWYRAVVDLPIESFVLQDGEVDRIRWISKTALLQELDERPDRFVSAQGLWRDLIGI